MNMNFSIISFIFIFEDIVSNVGEMPWMEIKITMNPSESQNFRDFVDIALRLFYIVFFNF